MAGRIRQEDIEAVRERADLVRLVSQYLTLKKTGADSMSGLCPFHTEKTPSFSVSPSKQVYYCFGCGAGGDAVRFLMAVESLTFPEAVERLAKESGVALRYEGDSPADRRAASKRQALHRANAEAAELFHQTLMSSPEAADARDYLAKRGITKGSAETFDIGWAPGDHSFLLKRLAPRFSPDLLVEAGLAVKDAGGQVRDRFRSRIAFPVHDLGGQAVGFGARLLAGDGPKYLNSPETAVYRKGEMLYNLSRAKAAVTRSGEAVVVEGYTDVIALAQAGVEAAVATCGTALGRDHFRLLARFGQRAVLAFDSDEAGARAAERAYAFHQDFPLQAVVLVLPEGLDPADFVEKRGGEEFREQAARAVPLVEYMILRALHGRDLASVEGRSEAVRAAMPIVAGLADPVRRQEYAHLLADRSGVGLSSLLLELERRDRSGEGPGPEEPPAAARVSPQHKVEWEMLKLLVQDPETYSDAVGKLTDDHFDKGSHRRLFGLLREHGGDIRAIVSTVEDERLAGPCAALATEPLEGEHSPEYAERIRLRLDEFLLGRRIDTLSKRLQRLNPVREPDVYDPLFEELMALEGERRRVRAQADGVTASR